MSVFHLKNCQRLVRINQKSYCGSALMYKFGQDDIKFLVPCVKYHMKTDVLITPLLWYKRGHLTFVTPLWQLGDDRRGQRVLQPLAGAWLRGSALLLPALLAGEVLAGPLSEAGIMQCHQADQLTDLPAGACWRES